MAHVATSFAKQHNRRKIIACSSSIGPGAANMITAAATATVNNIPLLLLPADTFACRQPDPVLQQFEQPISLSITTNDAYKPVCRYWDRVVRPEQLMSAMINAMRALTDTANAGAVCVSIPQDVEGESYDYPEEFFQKRVHKITRIAPADDEIADIAEVIEGAKKPLVIVGGGVRYSEAGATVQKFCEKHNIPFAETQNGKSAVLSSHELNLGGVGVTGNLSANVIAKEADVVIGIGTRFSDFTTASKSLFKSDAKFITINTDRFDAYKLSATKAVCDAKLGVLALDACHTPVPLFRSHFISHAQNIFNASFYLSNLRSIYHYDTSNNFCAFHQHEAKHLLLSLLTKVYHFATIFLNIPLSHSVRRSYIPYQKVYLNWAIITNH
jgi:3D-(3,5/4)-trihydroxycyclohexane-1,2-dione acylhydrolase (decyclizing)